MDSDVSADRSPPRRPLAVAAAVAFAFGLVFGGLATAAVLQRDPATGDPESRSAETELACTAIGATDGLTIEFTREDAADATSLTLVVRDQLQTTVLEQEIHEGSWSEDIGFALISTSRESMSMLSAVELTFHGPSGDRTLTAPELGSPIEFSPNGEHCEPHVLRAAFTVEGDALVRSDV